LIAPNQGSVEGEAAFVASVQGLVGFTRQAAHELNSHGIKVYAVETGEDIVEKVVAVLEEE
ncbi:MAG TPA: hypothetical protein VIS72_01270, partial [Anaerolineales bacterium]